MVVKDIWLHERSKSLWPVIEENRKISLGERPCASSQCVWFFAVLKSEGRLLGLALI